MNGLITQNSKYIEDVETGNGEEVSSSPSVAWDITVVSDAIVNGVVTLFDGTSNSGTKTFQIMCPAGDTVHCAFPRGKKFSTGIWTVASVGGLDLAVDYD